MSLRAEKPVIMLLVGSRRDILGAALGTPLIALSEPTQSISPIDIIANYTPREFRNAVSRTGRFLYRGESSIDTFEIIAEEPDLLIPGTYDSPDALDYFRCLERRLSVSGTSAIPSRGHIATSDRIEAAKWGEPVSIWPLGETLAWVWPKQASTLFPSSAKCPKDELAIDHDLEMALRLGHEVLFTSAFESPTAVPGFVGTVPESAFLAVSSKHEKELRLRLSIKS